ncbi:mucin-5AC-like isoform X2 [Rhopalosiphum padi]|nr:mucin-5AC-like isoform X2 [Rhopalosiphum padi]XP_060846682.1 mucin-5AC-like isoform X2 [Rhopalosiphum padi]
MWWPRPRWKSDIFTRFVLLLLFIITTTSTKNAVMADEGQQHCGASNMSAVVWTTVLCTMLLILAIVAIYFIYCKRREHDWSSLWWKNNSDKNLVLQTSAPMKNQQLKNGGTDNPAFSADAYNGDFVTRTGLTRVVRVSSSFLSEGSLENELSLKEEDGRKTYVCKHNDGSKDQLVALRLVFDKGQQQQLSRPPASELSRSLVELSRKYGLHVELETEGEVVIGTPEKCDDNAAKCAKSNILSTVCGQAQRLWHQRQTVFKGGDSGSRGVVDVEKEIVDGDLESGRVEAVHVAKAAPVQKSPCTVTTVNETAEVERPARNHGGSLRYRTLEYGASPADAEAQSSPDSGVQCCTVNPSLECVRVQMDKDVTTSALAATNDCSDEVVAVKKEGKDVAAVESAKDVVVTAADKDEAVKAEKDKTIAVPDKHATAPLKTVDDDKPVVAKPPKNDEPKHANPPPPPPPRKYSASVVPPTVPVTAAVAVPRATGAVATGAAAAACTASEANADNVTVPPEPCTATPAVPVACVEAAKPSAATTISEIRVDDDYYWCTTTAMAPPMSTFGKRPSVTSSVDSGSGSGASETAIIGDGAAAVVPGVYEKGFTAVDDGRDVVAGGTTSIEDASLPSFSSDEEEDDEDNNCNNNGVVLAADKSKLPACNSVIIDTPVNGVGAGVVVKGSGGGSDGLGNVAKTVCNGVSLNNNNVNSKNNNKNNCDDDVDADGSSVVPPAAAEPKSPTKLPTLRLSLSSPLSSTATTSCCSSSASSTSSTSPSPTNSSVNNSPIVSKIPVRRQSAGSSVTAVSTPIANGSAKKSIPLPLSRSGSRLAMWSSAN